MQNGITDFVDTRNDMQNSNLNLLSGHADEKLDCVMPDML